MTAGHESEHGTNPVQLIQRRAPASALGVNAALLIVELVGGIVFGPLALIATALLVFWAGWKPLRNTIHVLELECPAPGIPPTTQTPTERKRVLS